MQTLEFQLHDQGCMTLGSLFNPSLISKMEMRTYFMGLLYRLTGNTKSTYS